MSNNFDAILQDSEHEYKAVADEIVDVIGNAANAATDFKSFFEELKKLVVNWPPDRIAEYLALAAFKARAQGDANFDNNE